MYLFERAVTEIELELHLTGIPVYGTFHREGSQSTQKKGQLAFFDVNNKSLNEEKFNNMIHKDKFRYLVVYETSKEMIPGTGYYFGDNNNGWREWYTYSTENMKLVAVYKMHCDSFGCYVDRDHNLLNELRR